MRWVRLEGEGENVHLVAVNFFVVGQRNKQMLALLGSLLTTETFLVERHENVEAAFEQFLWFDVKMNCTNSKAFLVVANKTL